jgi:hypothetical protein
MSTITECILCVRVYEWQWGGVQLEKPPEYADIDRGRVNGTGSSQREELHIWIQLRLAFINYNCITVLQKRISSDSRQVWGAFYHLCHVYHSSQYAAPISYGRARQWNLTVFKLTYTYKRQVSLPYPVLTFRRIFTETKGKCIDTIVSDFESRIATDSQLHKYLSHTIISHYCG